MLAYIIEMITTAAFSGLVIGWAAMGRWGMGGPARVLAICGAALLFVKAAVLGTLGWIISELLTDAVERGEAPRLGLRLTESGLGLASGLLYAAGLACLAAALFVRHRAPGNATIG